MKTKLIIISLSLLLISCGDNTARKNHAEAERKAQEAKNSYRHDYEEAETLYRIANIYGFNMDKEAFHQSMESPANAEIFLNNLFEAGVLDEKKDILLWITLLYDGIPPELSHLDLGKGIDTNQKKGIFSDLIDEPEWIKKSLN